MPALLRKRPVSQSLGAARLWLAADAEMTRRDDAEAGWDAEEPERGRQSASPAAIPLQGENDSLVEKKELAVCRRPWEAPTTRPDSCLVEAQWSGSDPRESTRRQRPRLGPHLRQTQKCRTPQPADSHHRSPSADAASPASFATTLAGSGPSSVSSLSASYSSPFAALFLASSSPVASFFPPSSCPAASPPGAGLLGPSCSESASLPASPCSCFSPSSPCWSPPPSSAVCFPSPSSASRLSASALSLAVSKPRLPALSGALGQLGASAAASYVPRALCFAGFTDFPAFVSLASARLVSVAPSMVWRCLSAVVSLLMSLCMRTLGPVCRTDRPRRTAPPPSGRGRAVASLSSVLRLCLLVSSGALMFAEPEGASAVAVQRGRGLYSQGSCGSVPHERQDFVSFSATPRGFSRLGNGFAQGLRSRLASSAPPSAFDPSPLRSALSFISSFSSSCVLNPGRGILEDAPEDTSASPWAAAARGSRSSLSSHQRRASLRLSRAAASSGIPSPRSSPALRADTPLGSPGDEGEEPLEGRSRYPASGRQRQASLEPQPFVRSLAGGGRASWSALFSARAPDSSGAADAEAEALHRSAGLEVWGEMLPLGAASSLVASGWLSSSSSGADDAASRTPPGQGRAPAISSELRHSAGESPLAPRYIAQLPSGEALLAQRHATLSASYLAGHREAFLRKEAAKGWMERLREREAFRRGLRFLSLPLDTILFYLVVSPSDGLMFLQDGGPYLLLQHLELQRQRSQAGLAALPAASPAVDLYDLRYAHHCVRQKVCQAALRLRAQLEDQLLERETERAMTAAAREVSGEGAWTADAQDTGEKKTLETVDGGVRGYYRLACRLVDQFFAALYARLPSRRGSERRDAALGDAGLLGQDFEGAGEDRTADALARAATASSEATEARLVPDGRGGRGSSQQEEEREKERAHKFRRTTMRIKRIWEAYRNQLFSEEELPPFERLEVLWNDHVSPLVELQEAQGVRNSPHAGASPSPPLSGDQEGSRTALVLRLPSLVFHSALADHEDLEEAEVALKWATLKAMLRLYELLCPDAYTLAGGTDVEALRRALKKKTDKIVEAERQAHARGVAALGEGALDTSEEDEAIAAATTPAGLVSSASLRRKRLKVLESLEDQEKRERERQQKARLEQPPLVASSPFDRDRRPEEKELLFPFEWLDGPWLDSVLARAQEKRLLGSWLGGAARRHSGSADLFEHLLRSQASLSPAEALRFVAAFLRRYPRRPGLSEVQATTALRASEAEARDREQEQSRGGERGDRGRAPSRASKPPSPHDEEDGEGVFPVQQRALAGALLVGALDRAAGIIEPISSRLHAQIVSVGRQLVHLRERVEEGRGKSFLDLHREDQQKRGDERRKRRRAQGLEADEKRSAETADEFLLQAEEKRGGDGFLESQQKLLLQQLVRQQDEQSELLNLVERQLIAGVFLFLDEAVRFLRPSETSAALDLAALSSSYSPEEMERSKSRSGETLRGESNLLLDTNRVLQTFVETQLFIYDVFRSLRVVLHQQKEEAQALQKSLHSAGEPRPQDGTEREAASRGARALADEPVRRVPFPSLASLRGRQGAEDAPGESPVEDVDGDDSSPEANGDSSTPLGAQSADVSWPPSATLEPSEVPQFVENLVDFYRRELFDDMLPSGLQLRLASHLHDISAVAYLPTLAPRIHPLAIPVHAVSAAIGETGGRPWHMQWMVYIHEAIRDPALLGKFHMGCRVSDLWSAVDSVVSFAPQPAGSSRARPHGSTAASPFGCFPAHGFLSFGLTVSAAYAVLTALFDIWKRTALTPRLPFAAQGDLGDAGGSSPSLGSASPTPSVSPPPGTGDSGTTTGGSGQSLEVSPEMAEAQRKAAAALEAREVAAERHMHPVGCCQGLRKWLWIRRLSEENGWPFYVSLFRNEMTSDVAAPDSQAEAVAALTPWLKQEEEELLLQGCADERERQVLKKTLQPQAAGAPAAASSLFARLVANGLTPARAACVFAGLVRRASHAPSLPHVFPASHVPLNYDPRSQCPYGEAVETARKLQKGVDYDASAASDELSRLRAGPDQDDEEEEQRFGRDTGPTTEKTLTPAQAAAAMARAGNGQQAAKAERQGMFPALYNHWREGKTLSRAAAYALWGRARFEAAAAAGAAASGPEVLNEEERKAEGEISLWQVKASEKRIKDAAEAAFRLRLREAATKGPVHSDECINSPAFLCRISPPVGAVAPSENVDTEAGKQPERQQYSSLLHKHTADFLTDMVLVDHQLEHARRMRAIRALAATRSGGDCPEVFEQLIGDAVQQTGVDSQVLRNSFAKEDLEQLSLGTEVEKSAAKEGKKRLDDCRAEVEAGRQLTRLHGREKEAAAKALFHYFNLKAFNRSLPPDTRIHFSDDLTEHSEGVTLHPTLSNYQLNMSDFREPPAIRLAGSIRTIPVLAHALLQQCVLLATYCYDVPSKLHLAPPPSVARYLWQYLPPGKAQQKHFAPPPPSGCFANPTHPHLPPSGRTGSTRAVTPLPASFSDKPPSIASLVNFASQVPALMQQQQSLGAACRELGNPGDAKHDDSLQNRVMAKAKEAAASFSRIEKEFEEGQEDAQSHRLLYSQKAGPQSESVGPGGAGNISQHADAEKDICVEAANAVRAAASDPTGTSGEGGGEETGADAVLDAIKQEKVQELQQSLMKLALDERWPFYIEAPGTTKPAVQPTAASETHSTERIGGHPQSPPDWQQLLTADEMLKVLKYAVVDREGVASPSLYSDLILSGACSTDRAMQIMEMQIAFNGHPPRFSFHVAVPLALRDTHLLPTTTMVRMPRIYKPP
ncbi:hypothetical protein BESB_037660 [Besnoitia besnoiti]|uniref:Uncharacterized protein n=1 Tax=Besnoitia besnoiti TaxID=94643 RepID=A0A2A9MFN5_BESBE|nr:hypothetical protein BESB_037660 [Besnoitia besnoiti]PFH37308.1 hypothetical protein BESB_037660 [Besnoitia besnoiti]